MSDVLPLPPRPNLEQYKKLAKDFQRTCPSDDTDAVADFVVRWYNDIARLRKDKLTPQWKRQRDRQAGQIANRWKKFREKAKKAARCSLADAQFFIARGHGFESWPKFVKHLEEVRSADSTASKFERAADAIVNGDAKTLAKLLRENPGLVRERSTREHRSTLLHYVAANGVEDFRQKTPKNIVKIAKMLLDAGAEVNATCEAYGGGSTPLGLTATSAHPAGAGVMNDLLQLLLDHGADIEQPSAAGNESTAVFGCLANGQPGAARFLADHGAKLDLVSAAALGRAADLNQFLDHEGKWKPGITQDLVQEAFRYACAYGADETVDFLLKKGVDLAEHSGDGQTGLHYAVIGGNLSTAKLLLRHNPPLEAINMFGGSVLGQTLWSAAHGGNTDVYVQIIETLIKAGAKVPERHVPVNKRIDALLEKYGSKPEPKWWWYGEEPRSVKDERTPAGKKRSNAKATKTK